MTRTDAELVTRLATATSPFRLVHVPHCSSTMDLAAADPGDDAAVFWADHQTMGRGRQQRPWHDGDGRDLAVTFRVRPFLPLPVALPAVVPLCVLEALAHCGAAPLQLKWPNDVLLGDHKIAGVLIDATTARSGVFLIGIGINVNSQAFPPGLVEVATSLRIATGRTHERGELLVDLARRLGQALLALARGDHAPFEARYRQHLGLVGRAVTVRAGAVATGTLTGLDFDGGLAFADGRRFPLGQVLELRAAAAT